MAITRISDKAVKVNDSFTVNMYDNGYMVEIGGDDADGNWVTVKILANTLDELVELVREACEMDRKS